MKVLITGGNGFLGNHLFEHLRRQTNLHVVRAGLIDCEHNVDFLDPFAINKLIVEEQPDRIYHFVGLSRVSQEIGFPEYYSRNYLTTEHLITALALVKKPVQLFFASTVHVYGNQSALVTETSRVEPGSPYAFTKYLAEQRLLQATKQLAHLKVVVGRLYTCFGVGQATGFVTADFCQRIAQLPQEGGTLDVGPLNSVRQFLDAQDLATLLLRLLDAPPTEPFSVFNIASPHRRTIGELLNSLLTLSGKSPQVRENKQTGNPFQGLNLSTEKLATHLGVLHFRSLEDTLAAMYAEACRRETGVAIHPSPR